MKNTDLADLAELAQTLFEEIGDAVFIIEPETSRVANVNPMAQRLTGLSREQLLRLPLNELFRSDSDQDLSLLQRVLYTTQTFHSRENYFLRRGHDDNWTPVNVTLTRLHTERRPLGLILARDISERKLAEEKRLRESEERLRQITENLREVTFLSNADMTEMLYISPVYQTIWGRSCASVYENPRSWLDAVHQEDRPHLDEALRELIHGKNLAEEIRLLKPDGNLRWVRMRAWAVNDQAGRPHRIVGTAEDVTDQRSLEEQFRQSQKMEAVGKLAGGVAHDFNNLLTIINGYGDLVLEQLPTGDPKRALIQEITKAGNRAASLTRQLLTFSRRQILAPRVLDLRELIADAEKMLRRIIGEDVRLQITNDPQLYPVKADPGQLDQVLLNLAVNARDAMPQGGTLIIETRNVLVSETFPPAHVGAKPGPHVLMAVTDTGIGMDAATRERIFEPFFTTKGDNGTGLGLATVYAIVEQCNGYIEVESELGRGASFKLCFPAARQAKSLTKSNPGLKGMPRGTETVLVVEDEEAVRILNVHVLKSCGYNVLHAGHGLQALQVAANYGGRIDLVVTDVVMPEMGGRELTDHLARLYPETKVLFLSGYTDDAVIRHGVREAETSFLQKPFVPAVLAHKVREVLDASKMA